MTELKRLCYLVEQLLVFLLKFLDNLLQFLYLGLPRIWRGVIHYAAVAQARLQYSHYVLGLSHYFAFVDILIFQLDLR